MKHWKSWHQYGYVRSFDVWHSCKQKYKTNWILFLRNLMHINENLWNKMWQYEESMVHEKWILTINHTENWFSYKGSAHSSSLLWASSTKANNSFTSQIACCNWSMLVKKNNLIFPQEMLKHMFLQWQKGFQILHPLNCTLFIWSAMNSY